MRVVFDIGHGTDTKGKGVGNFKEHDFNSAVAIKARELAEERGFEVLYTQQPNSTEVRLADRCDWVNAEHKKKPILCLISFHANAASNTSANGWGVFHWHNSTKGKQLAELWAKYAKEILPIGQWGQGIWKCEPNTWTNFDIVRKPVMPCLLIEHFFFTNPDELKKCNTPEMIDLFAEVTVRTLCEYAGVDFEVSEKIMGKSVLKVEQMRKFLRDINPNAPDVEAIFLEEGELEGVRGDIAFCQAIHETNYFRFTGLAKPEWHNPAGLGVTGQIVNGEPVGNKFPDWRTGIRAQIQHLKAYASTEPLKHPCVDQRFHLVKRGSAPKWVDLNGKWAVPGTTYGQSILKLFDRIKLIQIDPNKEVIELLNQDIERLKNENKRLQDIINTVREAVKGE